MQKPEMPDIVHTHTHTHTHTHKYFKRIKKLLKKTIKNILGFIKVRLYKIKGGKGIYIGSRVKIVNGKNIVLGNDVNIMPYNLIVSHKNGIIEFKNGVEIGMFSRVASVNKVIIGENVITGPNVFIADYNHEYSDISKAIKFQGSNYIKNGKKNEVIIGDDCWIGTNVTIVGNLQIGKHCVIGANTVVTKNVPDYSVFVGNPGRVIKKYKEELKKWVKV